MPLAAGYQLVNVAVEEQSFKCNLAMQAVQMPTFGMPHRSIGSALWSQIALSSASWSGALTLAAYGGRDV